MVAAKSSQDVDFFGFIRVSLAGKNGNASGTRKAITEAKKHTDQDNFAGKNADASGTRRARTEARKQTDQDKERIHSQ
jgi:hypothetical protein